MSVRVRMAPSPTGFLHIGGVRTFLFNWLFARGRGGECLLRIENTDTSREVEESVEQIERSLRWLGLDWDGPTTFQLDRMARAGEEAARLVSEGAAYVDEGAIRIRMPEDGVTAWDDAIKGSIEFSNAELEDLVIVRSDGRPTYNFASPLEDWLDGITHVIRGDDHVSNTPKQIRVLQALGAEPPVYAHVPSVFGEDGRKLSKRHGAVSVDEFRDGRLRPRGAHELPGAARLGARRRDDVMSRDELVERFSLERVGSSPATFDYAKLDWMNGVYLRAMAPDAYAERLLVWLREQGYDWPEDAVRAAAPIVQEKIARLGEFPDFAGFLFGEIEPDPALLDARILRAAEATPRGNRAVDGRGDRSVAQAAVRRARREATHGLPSDPCGGHGLARLARPLREPRAARPRAAHSSGCALAQAPRCRERDRRASSESSSDRARGSRCPRTRIDAFAAATDDQQWIHVDRERAADGAVRNDDRPRLSDALPLRSDAVRAPPADGRDGRELRRESCALPCPGSCQGGRIRGRFTIASVEGSAGGQRATIEAVVECEGVEKPVCAAELVVFTPA